MTRNRILVGWMCALCALCAAPLAASAPPQLINYQGVLRDSSDRPLTGTYDMTFQFYDALSGGDLLLTDEHTAAGGLPVSVSDGLFKAALGAGTVTPGVEPNLAGVFANHAQVWLAIKVGTEFLTPRIRVVSAAYAQNANTLDGHNSTDFAATSHLHDASAIVSGALSSMNGGTGLTAPGNSGYVLTSDGTSWTSSPPSAAAAGAVVGASNATLTRTGSGIESDPYRLRLNLAKDNDWSGAQSFQAATSFPSSGVWDGSGNVGVHTSPSADLDVLDAHAWLRLTSDNNAAWGSLLELTNITPSPTTLGQINFNDAANSVPGQIAYETANNLTFRVNGAERMRVDANGRLGVGVTTMTAQLQTSTTSGDSIMAFTADGLASGVHGVSPGMGGLFENSDRNTWAKAGFVDPSTHLGYGISAQGNEVGGLFKSKTSSGYGLVGCGTYKIQGSGDVSFVQNHPVQKDAVIVYACPEGDEVATYTRGTARLVNGEARVKLGETFQWVTNPDIGLTAHLTPVGSWSELYVAEKSTTEIVVRSHGGAENTVFDYVVCGLRIGFEESSVVQKKQRESYIPAFTYHRKLYADHPELKAYNAIERFKVMESETRGVTPESLDLSRAKTLKEAIHEYDPATDPPVEKLFGFGDGRQDSGAAASDKDAAGGTAPPVSPAQGPSASQSAAGAASPGASVGGASAGFGLAFPCLPTAESVEEGDVLVMDPGRERHVAPCREQADPMVIGVAAKAGGPCLEDESQAGPKSRVPFITSGLAPCKADATYGAIHKGDLLVASPTPGHAMRADDPRQGTVIGKALEPLQAGTGLIKVLVMLR